MNSDKFGRKMGMPKTTTLGSFGRRPVVRGGARSLCVQQQFPGWEVVHQVTFSAKDSGVDSMNFFATRTGPVEAKSE